MHTSIAAHTEAPEDIPTKMPAFFATRRDIAIADSPLIRTTSSTTDRSNIPGTKPAPIPWIGCGPGEFPLNTDDSQGSTATTWTSGFTDLMY
jgi:hypothetical protein